MKYHRGFFEKKVAIVTGAASGIGRALSEELGRSGAVIVCADIDDNGLKETVSSITKGGGRTRAVNLDVTDQRAVEAAVKNTVKEYGRLDYIFNNAGIGVGGEVRDLKIEHWKKTIDVNIWGVVYGTTAAYRVMIDQGFGHIVNIASQAGLVPTPFGIPYSLTKHAVVGLSTSLRAEGHDLGVDVSAVCPGLIETSSIYESKMIKVDLQEMLASVNMKAMNVDKAARDILKGVRKKKPIIIVTFYAKIVWRIQRFFPFLVNLYCLKVVRDFRKIRKED